MTRKFLLLLAAILGASASAQVPREFDACAVFTAADAAKVLGTAAEAEPPGKGKPAKVVTSCAYSGSLDGKPQIASVQFRFERSPAEAIASLKETRLEVRGTPLIIGGRDAYWQSKPAQLNIVKGSVWLVISAGPLKESERQPDQARAMAEILLARIEQ